MENIVAEVFVPCCNQHFDFSLPVRMNVDELIKAMIQALKDNGHPVAFDDAGTLLCSVDHSMILKPNETLADQQIRDGSSLMLV